MEFDAWKDGKVAPSSHEVDVVAPRPGPKPEAVSPRLKRELIHPNREAVLYGLRFSPDGKRLIAGDYPGGVIQVWDASTGKQLTKVETGHAYRGSSDYFFLSPDWKRVYVSRERGKRTRVEKGGKRLLRWEFDGDVRAWDLDTGKVVDTFKHTPARGVRAMLLSPDGSTLVTFEELSGESEGPPERAVTLWDVKTKRQRPLSGTPQSSSVFSPDGGTLAAPAQGKGGRPEVKLFDVKAGKEERTIPVVEKAQRVGYVLFSPDGKVLVGQVRGPQEREDWLKFWDPQTGRELASFAGRKNDLFLFMAFSPDGRTLAVTNVRRNPGTLFLFDVPGRKLARTISLGEKAAVLEPAFSPDGKWLAVATQVLPDDPRADDPSPEDMPQPRIHLVDVARGTVREAIVCPQGFTRSVCFSPDGRTLASGGHGRVLLWDLTSPPGGRAGR